MVRWLCLSVVLAVLIPAGWQLAPKDLQHLSRYGAGWSRALGAAHPSPFLWLAQLSLFQCSHLFLNGSKLPPGSPHPSWGIPGFPGAGAPVAQSPLGTFCGESQNHLLQQDDPKLGAVPALVWEAGTGVEVLGSPEQDRGEWFGTGHWI